MKFIIPLVLLSMLSSARADENAVLVQLDNMARCQAFDLSLLLLHNQVAASITSLSSNPPKELLMIKDSYLAMAGEDKSRIKNMTDLIKNVIVPKIQKDQEEGLAKQFKTQVINYLGEIQTSLGSMQYESQVKVQEMISDQSHQCEKFAGQIKSDTL